MNKLHCIAVVASLSLLLAACNPGPTISSGKGTVRAKGDRITLSATGQPRAEIDAAGELTVDGKPVQATAEQRALLQTYHRELNGITQDGIAMGKQGAALAGKAVSSAIKGAISGKGEDTGKSVEADARLIEQQALKLCERLVVIRQAQDQLAAELPEFAPYATIELRDVSDCKGSRAKGEIAPKPETELRPASTAS